MEEQSCYTSLLRGDNGNRHNLIREYFFAGYTYSEIILILFYRHNVSMSTRQLHRILRSLRLRRHHTVTSDVVGAVQQEIEGSGSSLGYRSMTRRLLTRHGIVISRSNVSALQRELDPNGVRNRQMHRFGRRTYINKGPNYLIHIDGYDKLKRFGFAIHGAICGFSRKVLWLNVGISNNNPAVVASFFMDYVSEIKAVPRCLRIDAGTENVLIEDIQKAFRWADNDDMAGDKSVLKGSSHSNQRIERWWLSNRQGGCQYLIDLFKDLEDSGLFSTSNELHLNVARFCLMEIIQKELDAVKMEWNQHHVRRSSRSESPGGKPDIMYFLPHVYGTVDYKIPVKDEDVTAVKAMCVSENVRVSQEVVTLLERALHEKRLRKPTTYREAVELYAELIQYLHL